MRSTLIRKHISIIISHKKTWPNESYCLKPQQGILHLLHTHEATRIEHIKAATPSFLARSKRNDLMSSKRNSWAILNQIRMNYRFKNQKLSSSRAAVHTASNRICRRIVSIARLGLRVPMSNRNMLIILRDRYRNHFGIKAQTNIVEEEEFSKANENNRSQGKTS